ncbi:hypothetical protein RND81_02G168600 [Saponaria officinalis]|uniref:Uncharacterized protein n=1 Tax=Saponaria officinalis TaxID=3572 RepID=A0AAW1MW08_SAPOF
MSEILYYGVTPEMRERINAYSGRMYNSMPYEERWSLLVHLARESDNAEAQWRAEVEEVKAKLKELIEEYHAQQSRREIEPLPIMRSPRATSDFDDDDDYDDDSEDEYCSDDTYTSDDADESPIPPLVHIIDDTAKYAHIAAELGRNESAPTDTPDEVDWEATSVTWEESSPDAPPTFKIRLPPAEPLSDIENIVNLVTGNDNEPDEGDPIFCLNTLIPANGVNCELTPVPRDESDPDGPPMLEIRYIRVIDWGDIPNLAIPETEDTWMPSPLHPLLIPHAQQEAVVEGEPEGSLLILLLFAPIIIWNYLCFCVVHSQDYDQLLRGLNG